MRLCQKPQRALKKPRGGYRLISTVQISMVWTAYKSGSFPKYLHLRVYLALHEIAERRDAENRKRARANRPARTFHLNRQPLLDEIQSLVGGAGGRCVREALTRLERLHLVEITSSDICFARSPESLPASLAGPVWTMIERIDPRPTVSRRLVPVPRPMLRHLAREAVASLAATVFAHAFRCLWLNDGAVSNTGICSAPFAADVFGIDPRSVKRARRRLRELGWIQALSGRESSRPQRAAVRIRAEIT